jgi:threonine/homoserine/homoserine lactone efflux protein
MNTKMIAMILMVLGAVVLAYQGITFKSRGKPVDVLGVHVETTKTNYVPPVVGAFALIGGLVLFAVNPKTT